jgi:hypothetical protein
MPQMQTFHKNVLLSLVLCVAITELLSAQIVHPIVPEIRCQQLMGGATVLVITWRPGTEDFDGLSRLRVTAGARIAILHLTNGESLPSDVMPWALDLVAARRKEEAAQSARVFDGRAFFLNLPDRVADSSDLQNLWNVDTLAVNIAQIIALVKPHVLLLCTGEGLQGKNAQDTIIENAIRIAAHRCAEGIYDNKNKLSAWQIQCLARSGLPSGRNNKYFLTGKPDKTSASKILAEASRSCYSSLSLSTPLHEKKALKYKILEQSGKSTSNYIVDRIQITSSTLRSLQKTVRTAGESLLNRKSTAALRVLSTLDSISVYLKAGLNRYSELDQRAMILWKGDLDYVQARDAEQHYEMNVSDSIVTERQVFFVHVKLLSPEYRRGINQIMFHKTKTEDWIINESLGTVYDLNRDSVFRILSPEHLPYNTPVALHGAHRLTLDDPFRFSIIHQGKTRAESAIITKEVLLRYSPRHASVIQTPIVPISQKSQLIVDSYNYTRDPVDGMLFVKDSICWSDTVRFSLFKKDDGRRDTFQLHWADGLPTGDYSVEIRGSSRSVGSFLGRTISPQPSSAKSIAIISDRVDSPLEEYFHEAGPRVKKVPWQQLSEGFLTNIDVLIVDRDTRIEYSSIEKNVGQWIRNGGRLIILPQFSSTDRIKFLTMNIAFVPSLPVKVNMCKSVDGYQKYLQTSDETIRGIIEYATPSILEPLITTKDGKIVLAQNKEGRGTILLSALDLDAWIGRVDPAGYNILAKIALSQ